MIIPSLCHFIWLDSKHSIPSTERLFIHRWQIKNPTYGIMIWDSISINKLIYRKYPQYFGLWKSLKNKGKRSDFARYLILHCYGGFYLDADQEPIKTLDQFMHTKELFCKDIRNCFDPSDRITKEPIDIHSYDLILGSDNFSVREGYEGNIITNCFIASAPNNKFFIELVENRKSHSEDTVLNSFGTWALTDFVRNNNPDRFLELPSYYFNFIPSHMKCDPLPFTYSIHHSSMKWVDKNNNWKSQT